MKAYLFSMISGARHGHISGIDILYWPNKGILVYGDNSQPPYQFYDDEQNILAAEKSVKGEADAQDSFGPVAAEIELPDDITQDALNAALTLKRSESDFEAKVEKLVAEVNKARKT